MASRTTASLVVLALLAAGRAAAQSPAPLRLSFADAVRRAAGTAPVVELAGLRTDEAQARVRQARAALLPSVTASAAWVNRTFNKNSLGINLSFPGAGLPTLIGPFNTYDSRLQVTQTLLDFSSVGRVRAARAQATGAIAEGGAASEAAAGTAARGRRERGDRRDARPHPAGGGGRRAGRSAEPARPGTHRPGPRAGARPGD